MYDWVWLILLCTQIMIGTSLPTNLMNDANSNANANTNANVNANANANEETIIRAKPKRAQEILMFGNQQNRQPESASNSYSSNDAKRTQAHQGPNPSGLAGLKMVALTDTEKSSRGKSPISPLYDQQVFSPYDKNYEYSKLLMNELADEIPQVWGVPNYSRYYIGEDRRKRSEKSSTAGSTTTRPSTASFQVASTPTQQSLQPQVKRSVPIYQEPRFKRELNIDPEDVLTLLSLWEDERRNRERYSRENAHSANRNWRKFINEEYENLDDDGNSLDEEDPGNVLPWMDSPINPSRHYETLAPSDIGIVRTHPPGFYEPFGNQYGQQYETAGSAPEYAAPQYGLLYPQRGYYNTPDKRFIASRKRSQSYQPLLSNAAEFQLASQSRGYPYQHRLVY